MTAQHDVRLRQTDAQGRPVEFTLHETALRHEIVQGDQVGPDTQIQHAGEWVRLDQHPDPPGINELAARARTAAQKGDLAGIRKFAGRVLRFAGNDELEAVRLAKFLLAHLSQCAGDHGTAVRLLEAASHLPSTFSAAALGNLGTAWAHLRNPAAAVAALQGALAQDARFLIASVSLRNLAFGLADERALNLPGQPAWKDIAARESARLRQAGPAVIHNLLNRSRPFPGYPMWHVFGRGPHFPGLNAHPGGNPHGHRAATRLLAEAQQALAGRQYEQARTLAHAAVTFDSSVKAVAEALAGTAEIQIEEKRLLAKADRLAALLAIFFRNLDAVSVENPQKARESQQLLASFLPEEELKQLYRQRLDEVITEALARCDDEERRRCLLAIAEQYAPSESSDSYGRAAHTVLAREALLAYWRAVQADDLPATAAALRQATTLLGAGTETLPDESAILERLQRHRTLREQTDV